MSGINSKLSDIRDKLMILPVDFLIITETWLTNDIADGELLAGTDTYNICRTDRENTKSTKLRGGGVMIIVNKKFKASSISFPIRFLIEIVACVITWNKDKIAIIAIYSPGYDRQLQSNELSQILHHITNNLNIHKIILIGDFNLPSLDWKYDYSETSVSDELCPSSNDFNSDSAFDTGILEKGFTQKNHVPNNRGIFLDLMFMNFDMVVNVHHPNGIELFDNESIHHPAFNFELISQEGENEEESISSTKLDYKNADK